VLAAAWRLSADGTLWIHLFESLQRAVVSLLIGGALGLALGSVAGLLRLGDDLVDPSVQMAACCRGHALPRSARPTSASAVIRTVRIVRRQIDDPAAFPPDHLDKLLAAVFAEMLARPNPEPRMRTCPRVVKRIRHNSYRVKRPGDTSITHTSPPTMVDRSACRPPLGHGRSKIVR